VTDVRCPRCFEPTGPDGHPTDGACANALGKAIGQVTRATHLRAKKAWICPPMPFVRQVVVAEPPADVAVPATVLVVVPPLTPEEIARAAIFVLTGKIREVQQAVEAVQATPWPVEAIPD
jgi:hypothetical protein